MTCIASCSKHFHKLPAIVWVEEHFCIYLNGGGYTTDKMENTAEEVLSSKLVCLSPDLLDTFYYLFHSLSPYLKTQAVTLFLCSQSFRNQWRVSLLVVSPLSFLVSTYNGLEVGEKESIDHSKERHTVRAKADFWLFFLWK